MTIRPSGLAFRVLAAAACCVAIAACDSQPEQLEEQEGVPSEEASEEARQIYEIINKGTFVEQSVLGYAVGYWTTPEAQALEGRFPGFVDEFLEASEPIVREYFVENEPAMAARVMRIYDDNLSVEDRREYLRFLQSDTGKAFLASFDLNGEVERMGDASPEGINRAGGQAGVRAARSLSVEQRQEILLFEQQMAEGLAAVTRANQAAFADLARDFQTSPQYQRIQALLKEMVEKREADRG